MIIHAEGFRPGWGVVDDLSTSKGFMHTCRIHYKEGGRVLAVRLRGVPR